jgi:hypothetical protein
LVDGNVESFGSGVQGRVLETDVPNSGGVDERHQLTDIVDEETVEDIQIVGLQGREVEVLVDIGGSAVDHAQGSLALGVHGLLGVGDEAGEVLGDTVIGSEGCACAETYVSGG